MTTLLIFSFIVLLACAQNNLSQQPPDPIKVGMLVQGNIDPVVSNQQIHEIRIDKLQKKYLFIRLVTQQQVQPAVGFYQNTNGSLLLSCLNKSFDNCYISSKLLLQNTAYSILVMSNQPLRYSVHTYWADIQHIQTNTQIKFMFNQSDKTQLFHLQLNQKQLQEFQQIRIILRPQTARIQGDRLKIFANIGKQQPTAQKHQLQSQHVWNDAQVLFITRKQMKSQNFVGVYIVGNAKTVYIMQCQIVTESVHSLQINENIYQFLKQQQTKVYQMKFQDSKQFDDHVVRFSVFTGQVQVGFYYDKQLTNLFKKLPFQYMSDIQFHISKSELVNGTKALYMKVTSREVNSTFQLNMQGRKNQYSFQMNQNVYEFVRVKQKSQGMYFYSNIWYQSKYVRKQKQIFDITIIPVSGQPDLRFYICKIDGSEDVCKQTKHPQFSENVKQIKPTGNSTVGSKLLFTIELEQKQYKHINSVQKRALIIVEIISKNQDLTFAAVQYSDPNKVRVLREGRAVQDKVRLAQAKYYKFINSNNNVKQIRIHFNLVSGLTKVFSQRQDTRLPADVQKFKLDQVQYKSIVITQNLTQPVYIEVLGLVTSIYTISVSTVHKQHPLSHSLVLAQNIQYDIKLQPFTFVNLQIHPIQDLVSFQYSSEGGAVNFCEIDENDLCKQQAIYKSKLLIDVDSSQVRQVKFRVGNFVTRNNQEQNGVPDLKLLRTVKVKVSYQAKFRNQCMQKQINKVYSQKVQKGKCFQFKLPLAQNIQILASRQNIEKSYYQFLLCQVKVTNVRLQNKRFKISGKQISKNCAQYPNDIQLKIIILDNSPDNNSLLMDYSVQYENDIVTLADGIAYYTRTKSLQDQVKTFFYQINDLYHSFKITLFNRIGRQVFFGKIVGNNDKYNNKIINQAVGQITSKSENQKIYSNPYAEVKKQDISRSGCLNNCVLVLYVYSKQKPGSQVQFGIQVTQNQVNLKQNQIRSDFLIQGSVKYYEYEVTKSPTDLFFKVSDNNRKCTQVYMSNHPFPSLDNFLATQQQGSLIFKNAEKQTYYFSVKALKDCPYTVAISQGNSLLTKLQLGQFYDIKLSEGQQIWLYIKHEGRNSFKINTLLKYGSVSIWANQTELSLQTINKIQNGAIKQSNFKFKSSLQNSLTISAEQKQAFCSNCFYLIKLKAKTQVQGSVFLGAQKSKIQLTQDKVLYDQIKQVGSSTKAILYQISKGKIAVNVHAGKIKILMAYQNQTYSKIFDKNNAKEDVYQFKKMKGKHTPIQIIITALEAIAIYSLHLSPYTQDSAEQLKLIPGQSSMIILENSVPRCFKGILARKQDEILVVSDSDENIRLKDIKIEAKLDGKPANISNQIIGNVVSIKFEIKQIFFNSALNYSICLTSQNNGSYEVVLSVLQVENLNLISPDTQLAVRQVGNYAIHHKGQIIVDVFECQDKSKIAYSQDLAHLQEKDLNQLDAISIPIQNHAIRIQSEEVMFLRVNAKLATLLWMPFDAKKERGVGYYKYSIGKLSYKTSFNNIQFIIDGVFRMKETKTKVQSVKYTLYVSNSQEWLQKGVMCQVTNNENMLAVIKEQSRIGQGSSNKILINVQKQRLAKSVNLSQTLYFNVVADVTLIPPNSQKDHEHYKFIYPQQMVPGQLVQQNRFQDMDVRLLITLIVVSTISVIAILCVVVRWVLPILSRLKGRVLVQQNNSEHRESQMEAPPSSDRNQMSTGTDQRIR